MNICLEHCDNMKSDLFYFWRDFLFFFSVLIYTNIFLFFLTDVLPRELLNSVRKHGLGFI